MTEKGEAVFFFLMLVGIIASFLLNVKSCADASDAFSIHEKQCVTACGKVEVDRREKGMCVCKNGTVFLWQEGYTYKLGKK